MTSLHHLPHALPCLGVSAGAWWTLAAPPTVRDLAVTAWSCGWLCRWRAATQLSGANADDEIVEVFWTAIGQLTQDERGMVRHHVSSYELWSI